MRKRPYNLLYNCTLQVLLGRSTSLEAILVLYARIRTLTSVMFIQPGSVSSSTGSTAQQISQVTQLTRKTSKKKNSAKARMYRGRL